MQVNNKANTLYFITDSTGHHASMIASGIIKCCKEHGLYLRWQDFDGLETRHTKEALAYIVWLSNERIHKLEKWTKPGIPIISTIGSSLSTKLSTVVPDSVSIGIEAAKHLLTIPCRSYLYVGSSLNAASVLRRDAFVQTLQQATPAAPITFFDNKVAARYWSADSRTGRELIQQIRTLPKPLGLLAFSDQTAASCCSTIVAYGLKIPEDVAIIGVDDHPLFTRMESPLTTIRIDYEEVGRQAVLLLQSIQRRQAKGTSTDDRRFIKGELIIRESTRRQLALEPAIVRTLDTIHQHYAEPLRLSDLYRDVGMSRSAFSSLFVTTMGISPIQYLIRTRVDHAKILIAESHVSIANIADRVGIDDAFYFSRIFKKRTGFSPKEYRQHMQQNRG